MINEEDFDKLSNSSVNLEKEEETQKEELLGVYRAIIDILKYYCDIEEKYYSIISLWIIGTYFHKEFPTYPYLFFNAMKGSGKSRVLRLITYLSKEGSMLNSLTEAVLFRTSGTLGIDEFEGIMRKGNESLKELLNSAYKQGIKVKRMKKQKTLTGEEQVVEEFNVYRPILMCNIFGMEEVLGDRCIQIILSKSNNSKIIKKMEIYNNDTNIQKIKEFPFESCRLCRVVSLREVYRGWNTFIDTLNDTNNTNNIYNINNTNDTTKETIITLFNEINNTEISGRDLELMFPLILIAYFINKELLTDLIETLKEIVQEKRKEEVVENVDVALIDFVSQKLENKWESSKDIMTEFQRFVQLNDDWLNEKWLGRALKRLSLIKDKKRFGYGRMYMLDVIKAQEKLLMFR